MIFNKKITKIDLKNYSFLQSKLDQFNKNNFFVSALNLNNWKFYNIDVYFYIDEDAIYLYSSCVNCKKVYIYEPIIKDDKKDLKPFFIKSINLIKKNIINKKNIVIACFSLNVFNLFKKYEIFKEISINYIYDFNQLKFLNGKKMQKKRNHLNYFLKNYSHDSLIIKYEKKYFDQVLEFCKKYSVDKQENQLRENEINGIVELLSNNLDNSYGSILFYKNQIIGFTYGVLVHNRYEIFIEKADGTIRGSFQYLLTQNLLINNINAKYIDRQDDIDNDSLKHSKLSYKPVKIGKIFFAKIPLKIKQA